MFRRPVKEISAEFLAEDKYLDSLQQVVRESCIAAGLTRKDQSAVMLAIEEAATNIIRHAYLYEKGTIRLRIVIYRKLIAFSLIDTGRSFHPQKDGRFDLDRLVASGRKGGLGFYMIQKIMDSVEYISSAGFNELRMFKKRQTGLPFMPASWHSLFSLRVKFSLWTFFIVALIIFGSYFYIHRQTTKEVYDHLDATAIALGNTISVQAAGYILNSRADVEFDELVVSYLRSNPMLTLLVLSDDNNLILAHSENSQNIRKQYYPPDFVDPAQADTIQRVNLDGILLNHLIVPIMTGEKLRGYVHMTYSSALIYQKLIDARQRVLIFTSFLLLIGIVGIYLLSNYFVTPIVKITRRVRLFTSGDMETELPLEGAEEFFEISRAFNEMITRLSRDRTNLIEREKMAKEIEVASQIQKTLLPSNLPRIEGLQLDAFYRSASMVGGDLYDVFEVSPKRYCLVVADVSGKGIPASLVMSMLRTVIQIYAKEAISAKETLQKVNEYLSNSFPAGMFVTVMLAIIDSATSTMNFVSAGHNPMLMYHSDTRQITSINPSGMPLGLPDTLGETFAERLEEIEMSLKPDDQFLIYTDGITEATDRDGAQFGEPKLVELLTDLMQREEIPSIKEISDELVAAIDGFSGFTRQSDDITFIIARASIKPAPDSAPETAID